jgi:dihydroorotase
MQIPPIDDFHVHLRQGAMMDAVTPTVKTGGCRLAYIMVRLI